VRTGPHTLDIPFAFCSLIHGTLLAGAGAHSRLLAFLLAPGMNVRRASVPWRTTHFLLYALISLARHDLLSRTYKSLSSARRGSHVSTSFFCPRRSRADSKFTLFRRSCSESSLIIRRGRTGVLPVRIEVVHLQPGNPFDQRAPTSSKRLLLAISHFKTYEPRYFVGRLRHKWSISASPKDQTAPWTLSPRRPAWKSE
jgi:hypothetical protein